MQKFQKLLSGLRLVFETPNTINVQQYCNVKQTPPSAKPNKETSNNAKATIVKTPELSKDTKNIIRYEKRAGEVVKKDDVVAQIVNTWRAVKIRATATGVLDKLYAAEGSDVNRQQNLFSIRPITPGVTSIPAKIKMQKKPVAKRSVCRLMTKKPQQHAKTTTSKSNFPCVAPSQTRIQKVKDQLMAHAQKLPQIKSAARESRQDDAEEIAPSKKQAGKIAQKQSQVIEDSDDERDEKPLRKGEMMRAKADAEDSDNDAEEVAQNKVSVKAKRESGMNDTGMQLMKYRSYKEMREATLAQLDDSDDDDTMEESYTSRRRRLNRTGYYDDDDEFDDTEMHMDTGKRNKKKLNMMKASDKRLDDFEDGDEEIVMDRKRKSPANAKGRASDVMNDYDNNEDMNEDDKKMKKMKGRYHKALNKFNEDSENDRDEIKAKGKDDMYDDISDDMDDISDKKTAIKARKRKSNSMDMDDSEDEVVYKADVKRNKTNMKVDEYESDDMDDVDDIPRKKNIIRPIKIKAKTKDEMDLFDEDEFDETPKVRKLKGKKITNVSDEVADSGIDSMKATGKKRSLLTASDKSNKKLDELDDEMDEMDDGPDPIIKKPTGDPLQQFSKAPKPTRSRKAPDNRIPH